MGIFTQQSECLIGIKIEISKAPASITLNSDEFNDEFIKTRHQNFNDIDSLNKLINEMRNTQLQNFLNEEVL